MVRVVLKVELAVQLVVIDAVPVEDADGLRERLAEPVQEREILPLKEGVEENDSDAVGEAVVVLEKERLAVKVMLGEHEDVPLHERDADPVKLTEPVPLLVKLLVTDALIEGLAVGLCVALPLRLPEPDVLGLNVWDTVGLKESDALWVLLALPETVWLYVCEAERLMLRVWV